MEKYYVFSKVNMHLKKFIKRNINKSFQKLFINLSNQNKIIVINFHKITNKQNDINEIGTNIHLSSFKKIHSFLNNNFEVLTPEQFENHNFHFSNNEKLLLLTFDDGYKDNLD